MRFVTYAQVITTLFFIPYAVPFNYVAAQTVNPSIIIETPAISQIEAIPQAIQKPKIKKVKNYSAYRNKAIGCRMSAVILRDLGIGYSQRNYGVAILRAESGCNQFAVNLTSGAYGAPQSLPAHKMRAAGLDYMWNPQTQLKWFKSYVTQKYGTMKAARLFQIKNGWY